MQSARRTYPLGILIAVATGLAGVGQAWADDVFRACADPNNRQIRPSSIQVNRPPLCTSKETAHVWNQTGPQGPQGPQGPAGPSNIYVKVGQVLKVLPATPAGSPPGTSWVEIGTLDLPAGNYQITATASRILNRATTAAEAAEVTCFFNTQSGGSPIFTTSDTTVGPQELATLVLTGVAIPAAPQTVRLMCVNRSALGDVLVSDFSLFALKVGAFTQQ